MERAKGFEPSTPTLARLCSTPELHPHPLLDGTAVRPRLWRNDSENATPSRLDRHHHSGIDRQRDGYPGNVDWPCFYRSCPSGRAKSAIHTIPPTPIVPAHGAWAAFNHGQGFDHYCAWLDERGYHGTDWYPHDVKVREAGAPGAARESRRSSSWAASPSWCRMKASWRASTPAARPFHSRTSTRSYAGKSVTA